MSLSRLGVSLFGHLLRQVMSEVLFVRFEEDGVVVNFAVGGEELFVLSSVA